MRQFTLEGYPYPILPLFSPCGRWLYGHGGSGVVAWDLAGASAETVWTDFESGGFTFRVVVSPCGRYLAGAEDRCVIVWDTNKRDKEPRWIRANPAGDQIADVAFSPSGTDLLTACIESAAGVHRWRTGSWRRKPAFGTRSHCDGPLAVSPDGRTVATANCDGKETGAVRIKLWNYPQGTHRKTAPRSTGSIIRLAYSPDGALIASNDDWRRVQLWDARTLQVVGEYTPKLKAKKKKITEPVHTFAFHPSGKYLAVAGQAGPIEFVNTATWTPTVAFDWQHGYTYGVCFSADGTLAAAGSDKGKIVVWDVDL